jgi:Zn-dependent protease
MLFSFEYLMLFIPHMLLALTAHEAMHAVSAAWRGDDTAALLGRATLNPLKHIDPFGLIAFFIIGFGWAKPVPVNPLRLKDPRRDNLLISLAGPATNLALGMVILSLILIIYYPLRARTGVGADIMAFLLIGAHLNLGLCLFNLIPVPPLDGSHILLGLLPDRMAASLEPLFARGNVALLVLILLSSMSDRFNVIRLLVWDPMIFIVKRVLGTDAYVAAAQALKALAGG